MSILDELSIANGITLIDGNKIPRIGFGTFDLTDGIEAENAVASALQAGYRLIDCARFYGNEASVGRGLAESGVPREEIFITSKVWNDRQIDGTVRESVEESLHDLGIDKLDLLLIHWPVEERYLATWKVFMQMQQEGLVTSIGVSNFQRWHLENLIEHSDVVPVVDQLERHPYLQDDDTLEFCDAHGIVMEAWSPLGRGNCLNDLTIAKIAEAHSATPAQVILAWQMQCGVVPVPRSKNEERIQQNAQAVQLRLSEDEMTKMQGLNEGKPVIEGIDPKNFAPYLNSLNSHF